MYLVNIYDNVYLVRFLVKFGIVDIRKGIFIRVYKIIVVIEWLLLFLFFLLVEKVFLLSGYC